MKESKKTEIYLLTDSLDSELVERELKGERVEEFVYEVITPHGTEYTLSAVGIRTLSQILSKEKKKPIRIVECRVDKITSDGRDYIVAVAMAESDTGFQWVGSSVQPLHINGKFDPFVVPKATTKAQRNALRGVIPLHIIDEFIEKCLKEQKVKRVNLTEEVPTVTTDEGDIQPLEDVTETTTFKDENELWSEVYRRARRKWGDDFKEHLFTVIHTLFGKRHLSVIQLRQLLETLDEI
ncbi:MAG: hypothetical protein QW815_00125 [Nitrososphaerota archaeon]